jgi:type II secretory pathway pseudopilin PulG
MRLISPFSSGISRGPAPAGSRRPGKGLARRGFTLAEVMVASTIFWMVILGVYVMLVRAYQFAALARARDEARAVIRTNADQFERLQTTAKASNNSDYTRWLFYPEGGPSGRGLLWGDLSDKNVFDTPLVAVPSLAISLGESTHPVPATVSRDVIYVKSSDGTTTSTQNVEASGYMMQGKFTVNFKLNNRNYTESLTVLRAVP